MHLPQVFMLWKEINYFGTKKYVESKSDMNCRWQTLLHYNLETFIWNLQKTLVLKIDT